MDSMFGVSGDFGVIRSWAWVVIGVVVAISLLLISWQCGMCSKDRKGKMGLKGTKTGESTTDGEEEAEKGEELQKPTSYVTEATEAEGEAEVEAEAEEKENEETPQIVGKSKAGKASKKAAMKMKSKKTKSKSKAVVKSKIKVKAKMTKKKQEAKEIEDTDEPEKEDEDEPADELEKTGLQSVTAPPATIMPQTVRVGGEADDRTRAPVSAVSHFVRSKTIAPTPKKAKMAGAIQMRTKVTMDVEAPNEMTKVGDTQTTKPSEVKIGQTTKTTAEMKTVERTKAPGMKAGHAKKAAIPPVMKPKDQERKKRVLEPGAYRTMMPSIVETTKVVHPSAKKGKVVVKPKVKVPRSTPEYKTLALADSQVFDHK